MSERHRMPLSIHRLTTQIRRTLTVPPSPEALRRDQLPSEVIESIDQPESPKEEITKEPEISQTEDPDLQDEDGEDLNFKLVSEISELSKL